MTLLVRNEADIVDAQIAFHLHAGVDFVIATDNRSDDGTTEILERYERAGVLRLLREDGDDMRQGEWVTRMARLAAAEHEAYWVVNSDADEFWWPRAGSLKDVLGTIPERYGVVRGCWRHFLPRTGGDASFAERMTVRLSKPGFPEDKATVFHAHQKVAHRARRDVEVEVGNHNAEADGLLALRAWHPLEVLHFSFRSVAQMRKKSRGGWVRNPEDEPVLHVRHLDEASRTGRVDELFDSFAVDDEALERGLADGSLAIDTRLRDALRSLRTKDGGFALPSEGGRLEFLRPDPGDDAAYAAEASVLVDIDGIVRAEERVAALERRLGTLERAPVPRLLSAGKALRRLARP